MNNALLELLWFSIHIVIISFALGSMLKSKFAASGVFLVIIGVTSRFIRIGWIDSLIAGSLFETLLFFCSTLILYDARISKDNYILPYTIRIDYYRLPCLRYTKRTLWVPAIRYGFIGISQHPQYDYRQRNTGHRCSAYSKRLEVSHQQR